MRSVEQNKKMAHCVAHTNNVIRQGKSKMKDYISQRWKPIFLFVSTSMRDCDVEKIPFGQRMTEKALCDRIGIYMGEHFLLRDVLFIFSGTCLGNGSILLHIFPRLNILRSLCGHSEDSEHSEFHTNGFLFELN